ncbi:hypothetical protein Poli38472_003168 [Pythium oligandrum]|uniref:Enhancer of mRNA-decapping protein 4 WD40 repeat region domain-containing protein n=1 Tax=Pythium oligandrum TaxID=41045 RepID=A0A8K1C6B7_PYTOL|nr:hypothetical protein Poli38472_003168 [Pythium oligandrum]|eukprot:TMW57243.1 hypothetical protein Poli38472_003168 [Pythium oligandrum]
MSARRENEGPAGSSGGVNGLLESMGLSLPMPPPPPPPSAGMTGHMPPVVLPPPPAMTAPGLMNTVRFAPSDHVSPEVTQPPNPLQQLLYQQQQEAQLFMRQFLNNSQQQPPRSSMPPPPPPSSIQLMTPIQPSAYQSRLVPPPLPQTLQVSLPSSSAPPSIGSATGSLPRSFSDSSAAAVPTGPAPGTRITTDSFEYRAGGEQEQTASGQLEVTPVTIYTSQRTSPWGNMIAVNEQFIAYPIRKGLVRLLSQSSADRLLLREHEDHTIQDIASFNPRSELFMISGTSNKVVVYRIANNPVGHEVIKVVRTPSQRVIWHPFDPDRIAIVNQNAVYVTDLTRAPAESTEELTDMQRVSIRCTQTPSQINDVVFSPCGKYLVTGGMDGFVHIYRIADCPIGTSAELLHRFEPFDGGEVWSVRFFGGEGSTSGLLIGGDSNTKLSLWDVPLSEDTQPACIQTVKIVSETDVPSSEVAFDLFFDPSTQFLFVTDRARPVLFVLHLVAPANGRGICRFDNITEFSVTYPILSATVVTRPGFDLAMQLFTIQSQAIQRYNVHANRCYIPVASDDEETPESREDRVGQSVGALTTEGESEETSYQAPAESPRASAAPETELDVQTHPQQIGDDENEYVRSNGISPPASPRRPSTITTTHEDSSSQAGEDAIANLRAYARSSPSSSVRAFHDDTSQLGEQSIDESIGGSDHVLAYLRRLEAMQIQREDRSREAMQKMMLSLSTQISAQASAQVEKTIQKQIQTILVPAMGRIVLHTMENNFMKPVQAGFERVISERLIPDMEAKIESSIESAVPEQMENSVSDMVQRVVEDVRQPVRESFRECFRDIIIPSFQAATQKMFEQIHEHVLKGAASSADASREGANSEMASQLQQLVNAVDGLSRKVDQFSQVSTNGHAEEVLSPEERQLAAHKTRVLDYLAAKDYEEAFKYALGAQNVSLVTFTCQQCDARDVLSSRPPRLSQMIVLCLVQQLGADLGNDLSMKLAWLRESLLVMNPRDNSIAGFVSSVLQELQTSLNSVPMNDRESQYTLVHHILNSLLSSV